MSGAPANLALVCVILAIAAAAPTFAQSDEETSARLDALFGAHEPYEAFLVALKDAVAAGDKKSVAGMIAYPLATKIAGERLTLASEERFIQHYDRLFTPPVVAAVEDQAYTTLFATAEGVMIGDGEIWFGGICGDEACSEVSVKIISVHPPDGAPGRPEGADR